MATHSSVLAWRIPGTGEPDGLPSMGSHRVRHDWSDLAAAAAAWCHEKKFFFIKKMCFCMLAPPFPNHMTLGKSLWFLHLFSSVQSLSRVWLFVTPWTAAHQAFLSITNFQSLLKLMSIQKSHLLSSLFPSAFNHAQHQGLFQWVSSLHQVAKVSISIKWS